MCLHKGKGPILKICAIPIKDPAKKQGAIFNSKVSITLQKGLRRILQRTLQILQGKKQDGRAACRGAVKNKVDPRIQFVYNKRAAEVSLPEWFPQYTDTSVPAQYAILHVVQAKLPRIHAIANVDAVYQARDGVGGWRADGHDRVLRGRVVQVDEKDSLLGVGGERGEAEVRQAAGLGDVGGELGGGFHGGVVDAGRGYVRDVEMLDVGLEGGGDVGGGRGGGGLAEGAAGV